MLQSMRSQRVKHDSVTEQQQNKDNIGENLYDYGYVVAFLDRTLKTQSMKEIIHKLELH